MSWPPFWTPIFAFARVRERGEGGGEGVCEARPPSLLRPSGPPASLASLARLPLGPVLPDLAGQTPLGTNVDPPPADPPPPGRSGLAFPASRTLSRPLLCKFTPPTTVVTC